MYYYQAEEVLRVYHPVLLLEFHLYHQVLFPVNIKATNGNVNELFHIEGDYLTCLLIL